MELVARYRKIHYDKGLPPRSAQLYAEFVRLKAMKAMGEVAQIYPNDGTNYYEETNERLLEIRRNMFRRDR